MKKILIVMMMALLVLAGCTASDDKGEDVDTDIVLEIAGLEGGYGTAGWEAVVAAFTEETGIEVDLTLEKNIDDLLRPQIQAGDVPDVIYLSIGGGGGLTATLIAEEMIEDISDVLEMEVVGEEVLVKDKVLPGFYDSLRSQPYGDGNVYLSPMFYSPLGMFYNKNLFVEKDWDLPETWDEMWELADAAKEEGIYLFTYPTTGYFDGFFSSLLNVTAGPETYNKLMDYDVNAWESDEVRRAFDIVGKLAEYAHPNTVSQANAEGFQKNQALVMQDEVIFIPNGTWLPGEMEESGAPSVDGFEWGLAPVPADNDEYGSYASTFTEEIYIPTGAENVEQAKLFISFMYSDKATKIFMEESGQVQPTVNAFDMIPEDSENNIFFSVHDDGANANSIGFAAHEAVEGVDISDGDNGVLYSSVNSIVNGDMTVDEWYNAVVDAVQQYNE